MTRRNVQPQVAVILLNWNGWRDTIDCLKSLNDLRYPQPAVVLCDNASTDGSVEHIAEWCRTNGWPARIIQHRDGEEAAAWVAGEPRLLLVRNRVNTGFARGTNIALRYALASPRRYDYVWVLNTDTLVDPNALGAAVRALEGRPNIAGAQSVLMSARQPTLLDSAGMRLLRRGGAVDMLHHRPRSDLDPLVGDKDAVGIFGCCAAAALYRADALRDVGLFDESFFAMNEDVDLACRLRQKGYGAVLATHSVVRHLGGVSRDSTKRGWMWWLGHCNKLRVVARWYPRGLGVPILSVGLLRALVAVLRTRAVSIREWEALAASLWRDWAGGAAGSTRRAILRLGAAGWVE